MEQRLHRNFYDEPLFWDAMILLILAGSFCGAAASYQALLLPHGTLVTVIDWILLLSMTTGFGLTLYGSFIEPRMLRIKRTAISIKNAPSLRIVIASDFHIGQYHGSTFVRRIVERINALQPDVVCLLGDFVDDEQSDSSHLKPLKYLKATKGVFAVTGNHDAGCYLDIHNVPYRTVDRTKEIEALLEPMGIHFLKNEHTILKSGKNSIAIAGIDDAFMEESDLTSAIADVPTHTSIILLSHNPDIIRESASKRCNLILSGHTHGGQIRLPFIGPLGTIPMRIPRRFSRGLFKLNKNCTLFITQGLGETWARARLFCPPELVVMEVNA